MQLKEYLFYNRIDIVDFSAKAGISRQLLSRIMNGKCLSFRKDNFEKIVKATDGLVTYQDIVDEAAGVFPTYPGKH